MTYPIFPLTVSLPCFGRPRGTRRALECLANQTLNGWEAFVTGDACPEFEKMWTGDWFKNWEAEMSKRGNRVLVHNWSTNHGSAHASTNMAIEKATGKYFIFFANDDIILDNHFAHYVKEIEGTDLDFVYFNSYVCPIGQVRNSELQYGKIGHSELIVRTEFLRKMPPHKPDYGHDWTLISDMMKTAKYAKAASRETTYLVGSLPNMREPNL